MIAREIMLTIDKPQTSAISSQVVILPLSRVNKKTLEMRQVVAVVGCGYAKSLKKIDDRFLP